LIFVAAGDLGDVLPSVSVVDGRRRSRYKLSRMALNLSSQSLRRTRILYFAAVLLTLSSLFTSGCRESTVVPSTIGVFRGGQWFVDLNDNGVWDGKGIDRAFAFGGAGDVPVVGDWNGSGKVSVGVFKDGQWRLDLNGNLAWDGPAGGDRQITFGAAGDIPVVGHWEGGSAARVGVDAGRAPCGR